MSALSPLRASLLAAGLFLSSPLLATDAPSWNVNQPQGPLQSISIDVTQGTWMNVDISPDGTTLVFDLLGDIYQMPIEGGEATPLIKGIAWHMQPRFSPDGNYIAFTSDQDGGDNIWIMNADGSEPRPVSSENFRLLNSPAWSPDSQYLVGRKHYTAQRSLGAGEVWMYHVQGGDGIQLTERPNDQKDLGEPAFSPDGRYLYFSQDATPGKTFHYSKDSVQGIYKIKRYDRHSGDIEVLLSGTGGAIRPTPSPDGKTLAYISRDGFQTSLYLYDLQSGQKRKIYDRLDRDMQETWAIHGVYPTLAWTPDNQQLLFWAGGQIHKLNVHSGVSQVVPFHVATDKQVQPAVRFSQQLDPDQFDVKMLRQVQVSPDGNTVVFEALGKLWQRPMKGDKPQRVTTTQDGFELFPQFSRDGKHLVFASWQDDQQGAIKVINLKRGKVNTLTTLPGKYVEPTFSPDGRTVVYRKVDGGYITPATWDNAPGIYRVSAEGGTPLMISDWGTMPHFGHRNDRLFLTTRADDKPALASVNLDGFDRRTHFTSDHATEFHVSPDGNKLAFAERFKVFLTPFASHGETQHIGPNGGGLPVKQLSQRAGENLSWNPASTGLYWSLGPELYQANVEQLFDPSQPEVEPASVTDIGFQADTYVPRETIAFVGGQVITMNGDHIIQDGVVIVEDNRIAAVGSRDQVSIPTGTRTIDIKGKTLMPGLFDAHAHGSQGNNEIIPEQNRINFASLALGVTSIHDPSNDTTEIFAASELQKSGDIIGPRIFSTGTILYGANGPGYTAHVDSLEDAKFHLERLKKVGAFSVKSYNQPRRNQRQQIIAAARELEMMVVPEGGSLLQHNLTMIADGHTGIEHALPVASIYDDIKQFWSQTKVGYTPTLVVAYGGIWGENYWYDKTEVWKHPRLSKFVPQEILRPRAMRRTTAPDEHYNHFNVARVANELRQLGISSNIGAHGQRESLGAHWEIWMFAQGGMSNLEALKTATINPARHFAMDQQIGTIETGKLADLIVIDGDPLANIRDSDKVHYTMVGGRLYDAATMNELNGKRRQRAPFYFE